MPNYQTDHNSVTVAMEIMLTMPVNGNGKKPDSSKSVSLTPSSTSKRQEPGTLTKTVQYLSGMLFSGCRSDWPILGAGPGRKDEGKREREKYENSADLRILDRRYRELGDVLGAAQAGATLDKDILCSCKVVVIGVHGWFPGMPTALLDAPEEFQTERNVKLEKVTTIPLEGERTIKWRVDKLYDYLLKNQEWMDDIPPCLNALTGVYCFNPPFGPSHQLVPVCIRDEYGTSAEDPENLLFGYVRYPLGAFAVLEYNAIGSIVLGRDWSSVSSPFLRLTYLQHLEPPAARELLEFQNTESEVSKDYVRALRNVLGIGVKMVSSDFLANLLVHIVNSGISDSGLLAHLSEATADSLIRGVGHSTPYEEIETYASSLMLWKECTESTGENLAYNFASFSSVNRSTSPLAATLRCNDAAQLSVIV
ncbi:hypothetical protein F5887DRAFT_1165414 [Amanita rubescens]|nr:hypothetical protein F5887DRAFT_1165414 [Amanita rubescens]